MFVVKRLSKTFNILFIIAILCIYGIYKVYANQPYDTRVHFMIGLSMFNVFYFCAYKYFLSKDQEFVELSGIDTFNWWNELSLQLCNINMLLIPIGFIFKSDFLLGFSFFIGPMGAILAIFMPEPAFSGYSLLKPRILGFYGNHYLLFISGISLMTLNLFVPDVHYIPGIVGISILLTVIVHIINTLLRIHLCKHANYFFTYSPGGVGALEKLREMINIPLLYICPLFLLMIPYMYAVCKLYAFLY